jgi:UDP-N-acetylglucosamine diphosphorylase / glucose-1-phosphate thymidylyltransferase / UDP-N-acetylgalactosamine diphosphorylase / glucosamine-1-phosphate N-acetyltransferase / galactosamine-1-phosphate N-acetyltransferase
MAVRICVFEDTHFADFFPLTTLRPVFTLRPGLFPLFRRVGQHFPEAAISLIARDQVASLLAETNSDYPVGIIKREASGQDVLFLNGRIRDFGDLPRLIRESRISTLFKNNGETVAVLYKLESLSSIPTMATPEAYLNEFSQQRSHFPEFNTSATLYGHCWDMVNDIESAVAHDIEFLKPSLKAPQNLKVHEGVFFVKKEAVYLGNDVELFPGVVIDASKGPVLIGPNTRVESHTAIYGPCFIGANSVVVAGKITACSIGPTCRVGGEVEESIFQSYVNKYHAGFIGHSYVGSWVNFGAMTTNSDLKNNYSNIRLSLNGNSIDTGSIKIGSFIGDHTKFGIGTLLNTGISVGICCNLFGGGLTTDKEVPPFSWGNTGRYHKYALDKALETAQRTNERRNCTLSANESALIKQISEGTIDAAGAIDFV